MDDVGRVAVSAPWAGKSCVCVSVCEVFLLLSEARADEVPFLSFLKCLRQQFSSNNTLTQSC